MAFIVGYVSQDEAKMLEAAGYKVEDASQHGAVGVGRLLEDAPPGDRAVVIFVDCGLSDLLEVVLESDGPCSDRGAA